MTMSPATPNIAILIANGFDETQITAIQRALTGAELAYHMVAPEQGLANGWQDGAWGHYFTVDQDIATAMGSDYDCLIIVGGERGVAKLKDNLHTRRIVNHFLEAGKSVSAIAEGVQLLTLSPKSAGRSVASVDAITEVVGAAQMEVSGEDQSADGPILSSKGTDLDAWVEATIERFTSYISEMAEIEEQAA